ncbi:M6 family metalloprotease [Candidatus Symbiothrix dinenymphae]|nr:M6 family metalloprotease [Candidatus Symbiothrix dinenymphae]
MNRFFITFAMIMLLLPQQVRAVSAYPHPVEYTQPDGTRVVLTLRGDEHLRWAVSEDGYTLLSDSVGFYEYAVQDDGGNLKRSGVRARNVRERRASDNAVLKRIPKNLRHSEEQLNARRSTLRSTASTIEHPVRSLLRQHSGLRAAAATVVRAPLILVEFPDKAFTKTDVHFERLMNEHNATQNHDGEDITGSINDYFRASSYGMLDYQIDVFGPFMMSQNIASYDDARGNPIAMAREAVIAAHAAGCDFTNYDSNNDGVVDGVHIIFAGYGQEEGARYGEALWSHAQPVGSIDVTELDGMQIKGYSCSPELRGLSGGKLAYIGTIAHELGHVFGLPDLYDTDGAGSRGNALDMGDWDIMGRGNWLDDGGRTPALHSAWCRNFLGWVPVQSFGVDSITSTITLPDPAVEGVAYKLPTKRAGEYFLLENRQKQGWDEFLPASGLLIYHVDENWADWRYSTPNRDPTHRGIYVKQAGGGIDSKKIDRTTDPYPYDTINNSFTDTSVPNARAWNGAETRQPITNITHNTANRTVTFQHANLAYVPVTGVALNADSATLFVGQTLQLTGNVLPMSADSQRVTWTSSLPAVATVDDNGLITAIAIGTATITVETAEGNFTTGCEVTVSDFFSVTFNSLGGNQIASREIILGNKVPEPIAPSQWQHIFGGWFQEEACIHAWDFANDVVTADTTLYARWTEDEAFFRETFEDNSLSRPNWNRVNGYQVNQWYMDTATASGGFKSAYISNDGGASNLYSIDASDAVRPFGIVGRPGVNVDNVSVAHLFCDITFPDTAAVYSLSFDWKCVGEISEDELRVFIVDTSKTLSAGEPLPINDRLFDNDSVGDFFNSSEWQQTAITLPHTYCGKTKRLVFSWTNDHMDGTQSPAAIDNIALFAIPTDTAAINPPDTTTTNPPDTATTNLPGTGVQTWRATSLLQIYTDPTQKTITIKNAPNTTVTIYNSLGEIVHARTVLTNEETINIATWPHGIYLVKIAEKGKGSAGIITGKIRI